MALRPVARRELPDWLDQSIEARHTDLPLAILSAFVDAQRIRASGRPSVPTVSRDANTALHAGLLRQFRLNNERTGFGVSSFGPASDLSREMGSTRVVIRFGCE